MKKKVLLAAKKPFADDATQKIREEIESKGLELVVLSSYKSDSELLQAVRDVHGLIVRSDKVTKEVIDAAQNLAIIARAGAGYDTIDSVYARSKGIIVENTPGMNSNAVAELTMHMMHQAFRPMDGKQGLELKGKKFGIHGFGNIGSIIARLAKSYGMHVSAYDVKMNESLAREHSVAIAASPEQLYTGADVVSLNIPLTASTKESIGSQLLTLMNPEGLLINTSRAGVINLPELESLLASRTRMKYFTDVVPTEKDDNGAANLELFKRMQSAFPGRVFGTPVKMGAETLEANVNAGLAAAKQVVDFLTEGMIRNCVYSTLPQRLQQYGQLAESLARLNSVFVPSVTEMQFTCYGELNEHSAALKEHLLRGLMMSNLGNESTLDEAVAAAKRLGIAVKTRVPDDQKGYGNAITVDLKNGGSVHSIRGRVDVGRLYASRIDHFTPNMPLEKGVWVIASYQEGPGMADRIGDPLVSAGFNRVYLGASPSSDHKEAFAYFMLGNNGKDIKRDEVEKTLAAVDRKGVNYVKVVDLR